MKDTDAIANNNNNRNNNNDTTSMLTCYREHCVWPLTSTTSIYSGATTCGNEHDSNTDDADVSNGSFSSSNVVRWATELHTCSLQFAPEHQPPQSPQTPLFQSQSIRSTRNTTTTNRNNNNNNNNSNERCVGYSTTSDNGWEVLTLVDTSKIQVSFDNVQQQQQQFQQFLQPSSQTPSFNDDDSTYSATAATTAFAAATTTTTTTITGIPTTITNQATQQQHHRRNSSLSSIPEGVMDHHTSDAMTTTSLVDSISSSVNQPPPPPPSGQQQQQQQQYSSFDQHSTTTFMNTKNNEITSITPNITITDSNRIGRLIVRRSNIINNKRRPPSCSSDTATTTTTTNVVSAANDTTTTTIPVDTNITTTREEYTAYLDFRPLAVKICDIEIKRNNTNMDIMINDQHRTTAVLIWIGSADQNQLHCYGVYEKQQQGRDGTSEAISNYNDLSIINIDHHDAFRVLSPVMGIQHLQWMEESMTTSTSSVNKHCLVLTCQDGTVRIVLFDIVAIQHNNNNNNNDVNVELSFQNVQYNQVIIDGPVVAVHVKRCSVAVAAAVAVAPPRLNYTQPLLHPTIIHITVGSLCGYVAELYVNAITMEFLPKEGPSMVIQGFWNSRLQLEDSVMAIYRCRNDDTVCIGTQAGRCYIYRPMNVASSTRTSIDGVGHHSQPVTTDVLTKEKRRYHLIWSCQLQYPIHSIMMMSNQNLIVTTRRSVHFFRQRLYSTRGMNNPESIVTLAHRIKDKIAHLQRECEERKMEYEQEQRKEEATLIEEEQRKKEATAIEEEQQEEEVTVIEEVCLSSDHSLQLINDESVERTSVISTDLNCTIARIDKKEHSEATNISVVTELVDLI